MRRILEVARHIKRRGCGVMACPNCGDTHIRRASSLGGFLFPTRFLCSNCGYSGYFVVEIESLAEAESSES